MGFARLLVVAAFLALASGANAQGLSLRAAQGDPIGSEVSLPERTILYLQGESRWEAAFETILEALKTVSGYLEREGEKAAGDPMVIYTSADDLNFKFQAAFPILQPLKNPPQGELAVGPAPTGRAYKFVHRGSYDTMDNTYEAITNFLDERGIDAKDMFIEEYVTNPLTSSQEQLVINVIVPVR